MEMKFCFGCDPAFSLNILVVAAFPALLNTVGQSIAEYYTRRLACFTHCTVSNCFPMMQPSIYCPPTTYHQDPQNKLESSSGMEHLPTLSYIRLHIFSENTKALSANMNLNFSLKNLSMS
mmetsp:Transcript_2168/g.3370  ORF Transcript_2168/g.3370 Transcript_2168/m.3370 type:complete len:120 (+) Transcript_2168:1352-1711(+)